MIAELQLAKRKNTALKKAAILNGLQHIIDQQIAGAKLPRRIVIQAGQFRMTLNPEKASVLFLSRLQRKAKRL